MSIFHFISSLEPSGIFIFFFNFPVLFICIGYFVHSTLSSIFFLLYLSVQKNKTREGVERFLTSTEERFLTLKNILIYYVVYIILFVIAYYKIK